MSRAPVQRPKRTRTRAAFAVEPASFYRALFSGLKYRGVVNSVKRAYHLFEGSEHYVLVSPGQGPGGNYTIVPKKALDRMVKLLGGTKSVTSLSAFAACRRSKFFPDRWATLNALYVLVGIGAARISKQTGQTLFFDVLKHPG